LMTIEPAKLCGLENRGLGSVAVHGPADITIIDPAMQWTLTAEELAGKSSNTPFLGRSLTGRAVMTIVAGVVRNCLANAAS
ncbi:MAG: dihydroorotase, partial [Planctomycetota bacterium]